MERIKARRGKKIACKGWRQEAILRMLQNNLENAEKPEELIIYGGTGKAARNWDCYHAIVLFTDPALIEKMAMMFGSQCVVASLDYKRNALGTGLL